MNKSPYEVLGVEPKSSQKEVRDAYLKLAKLYHPDLHPGDKVAELKFKEVNAANELIGTAEQRAKFDHDTLNLQGFGRHDRKRYGNKAERASPFSQEFNNEDFFSTIFGDMGRDDRVRFDVRGEDQYFQVDIEFIDAVLGAEREVRLPNGKNVRLKIPPGVVQGAKLRLPSLGGSGVGSGLPGDVFVELNIRPSSLFRRSGNDLEIDLPISIAEAVLGADIKVPTVDGSVLLKIPPNVSSGQRLRIQGKGVKIKAGKAARGDQYVLLKIVVPKNIDQEFRQAVASWKDRQAFDPRASIDTNG